MLLHNPAKLPPIDRFEKLPKNAIDAAHARLLSESRQPESIQFALDVPGMRCGIVNHSPDSPALAGRGRIALAIRVRGYRSHDDLTCRERSHPDPLPVRTGRGRRETTDAHHIVAAARSGQM